MNKLKQKLEKILKQDKDFIDSETGEADYIKVKDSADSIDAKLISLLASDKEMKQKFFSKIKDIYVFNINDFKFFVDESKLDNSYTKYTNRIGLSDKSELLKNRSEVVLNFPFKDCVLEGGQSTEEGMDEYFEYYEKDKKYQKKESKRKEVFFNQVLAHDEIDRLFDRKALVNWKRFVKGGNKNGEAVKEIKRNSEGVIKDNLIIKGNNLLALHSLKSEFAGKIKLIYIDPPYNTGTDSFAYNDKFNHSTWLTFMKNRLEIAKELLKDDGVIFVQCDDNEQAYLKVLVDEIFKGTFLNTISVKAKVSAGASGGGEDKRLKKNIEYIHCYYKNSFVVFNDVFKETEIVSYIEQMKNDDKSFKYTQVLISAGNKKHFKTIKDGSGEDIIIYKHSDVLIKTIAQITKEEKLSLKDVYKKYFNKIFTTTNAQSSIRQRVWDATGENKEFYSIEYIPKSGRNKGKLTTQYYTGNKMVLLIWFRDTAYIDKKGNVIKKEKYGTFWDGIDYNNLNKEGNTIFPSGKKPEQLIQRVIEMSTKKDDIVLDYHLGSGGTCAVAHKMNLQYIGIEQLDYGENDSVIRLNNVINGDESGISRIVNWKGGGDFIYCELAEWNEKAKKEINKAENLKALEKLFDSLYEKYFLNYNVKIKDFKEKIIKEENFKKLSLAEQKRMFLTMLDLNQMYVQESEMADKRFGISNEDQKLTKEFYKNK